ncbi:MAG: response regulator transcription factor [Thermomicrobiales bacterium]|nr:response regulator transcription factor [Thermomicrobiales bacterium]
MKRGARILVVEDDRSIARLLELELGHRGFEVRCVFDGRDALSAIESFDPAAIVLDILLPGMDGEQILARLRRSGDTTPVIMLTARDRISDKVRNLETGADDYLTKPFQTDELVARLRAVMRRSEPDVRLRIGDLVVDPDARAVELAGNSVELTAREFELLALLASNTPNVVSRATILDRVWGETPDVHPNIVDVYVGYLRRKLETHNRSPQLQTVRGIGFSLRG